MKKILVVDDQDKVLKILLRFLQKEKYDLYSAQSVQEAKSLLKEHRFDVLLLDFILPDGDGLEIYRFAKIRDQHIQAVILTGYVNVENIKRAIRVSVFDFLEKPIDGIKLRHSVRNALRHKDMLDIQSRHLHELENFIKKELDQKRIEKENSLLRDKNNHLKKEIELRKLVEQKLNTAENYGQILFNGIREGILFLDLQGTIQKANHYAEKMALYADDIVGKKCYDSMFKLKKICDNCPMIDIVNKKASATKIVQVENGVWWEIHGYPVNNDKGEVIGVMMIIRDITSMKQAEKVVQKKQQEYKELFDNSPTSIWVEDISELKKYLDYLKSEGVVDIIQYLKESPEELIKCTKKIKVIDVNKTTLTLFQAESLSQLRDNLHLIFQNESFQTFIDEIEHVFNEKYVYHGEGINHKLDGTPINVQIKWIVPESHRYKMDRIILSVTNITEQKRLEKIRTRLEQAIEHSIDSILITEPDGSIIYTNKAFEKLTGYSFFEAMNQNVSLIKSGKHSNDFYAELWGKIKNGKTWQGHLLNQNKQGDLFEVDASISPVFDEIGNIQYYVAIYKDITDRIALEQQLKQAQKMEAIGQLAGGIAHEINSPMQFVGANTHFLKDAMYDLFMFCEKAKMLIEKSKDAASIETINAIYEEIDYEFLKEDIQESIVQSLEGIDRISDIVRAMKEFSHPGSKSMQEENLNRAITSTVTIAKNEWKYSSDIEFDLDPALPSVKCFVNEINQVILNMIVNAVHAIQDRFGEKEKKGKIKIKTLTSDDFIEIHIQDNGNGIPEEIQRKIFDRFFTTKEVGRGTGQGLAISRKVIEEKHNGKIELQSKIGEGTTFILKIPQRE